MKPEAIFFDLDGTLIDTAPDMGGALNRMLEKRQRPLVSSDAYRSSVSHGSIALIKLGFPELQACDLSDNPTLKALRSEFLQTYADGIYQGSVLFDGVEPLLAAIESANLPWGIITNKPEGLTLDLLDQMKITDRCCSIVAADTTTHAKPHPAPMKLACERAGVDPALCFYVGDTERDIEAGRSVDMKTFIAGWGYIDEHHDKPDNWGADIHLNHPQELVNHL